MEQELIQRYHKRLRELWNNPNPYIIPLWEASEINQKIKELEKIIKNK